MYLDKCKKILIIVFLLDVVLVSTNEGEFWPFSIYPMFSQARHTWSRGVVLNIKDRHAKDLWKTKSLQEIRGHVVALDKHDIDDIDYANFISKTKKWDAKRIRGLRAVFQIKNHPEKKWMASRVTGHLARNDSVVVEVVPMFLFTADSTFKNPHLFSQ